MNMIKKLLKRKGILQKQFAIDIGVSQPTVSDWVHNKKDPSGENLIKVAEYFDVSPDEIKGPDQIDENEVSPDARSRGAPRTTEARILSAGVDKMPARDRDKLLNMVRVVFDQYADFFEEGIDDDDPES